LVKYSIIISAWNRKDYIRAAFQSAMNQDYFDACEIIVVSNFIDDLLFRISLENPDRVRYIVNESQEFGAKMVAGIMASRGRWICLLDDDDLFCPNKLSVIDRVIETEKNAGIIKNLVAPVDAMGKEMKIHDTKSLLHGLLNPIENYPELRKKEYPLYYDVSPFQESYFSLLTSFTNNSSLTLNKEMLINHLETLKGINLATEHFFLSIAVMHGKKLLIAKDVLSKYRIDSSNSSDTNRAINNLERTVRDFKIVSIMPIPAGYRKAMRTTSARLKIYYLYRMRSNKQIVTKEILRPAIIPVLLYAVFGKPEIRIFLLIFHLKRSNRI